MNKTRMIMIGAYFKPLRRKIGVMTLVLAQAFAVGWVQSWGKTDVVEIRGSDHRLHLFISGNNWIGWVMHDDFPDQIHPFWFVWGQSTDHDTPFTNAQMHWDTKSKSWSRSEESISNRHLIVPYAAIVIVLSVLSAWLLLSKPRIVKAREKPA